MTKVQPSTATAQSTQPTGVCSASTPGDAVQARIAEQDMPEQSITTSLTAEIMTDLDDGQQILIASASSNQGDVQVVAPARLLRMVDEARTQLDRIERMAREYEARDTLAAILAEHQLTLEEWDPENLDPKLRAAFRALHLKTADANLIVVPPGQDPIERVNLIAALVNRFTPEGQA